MRDLYYDPYYYEIDANPHPVWKRMRDEAPVYRNEKHDFYALSRFQDVLDASMADDVYSSAVIADTLGFVGLDEPATPRGIRALADVPRLPDSVRDAILGRFSSYDQLVNASAERLAEVDGVGRARASTVRNYLARRGTALAPLDQHA